jgi:poly-gamma-glutamate synthesis protein (capsule biosynthesis protein)
MSVSIIIGGDLVPTKNNFQLFERADVLSLLGNELIDILTAVDIRIFNFEVPLTDSKTPIEKFGPNLIAPINTIHGIKAINPTILGLANNHILDQKQQGLLSTINVLEKYDIIHVGSGNNLQEAAEPVFISRNNKTIGVYACAEHEFTIASEITGGANPFDMLNSFEHIKNAREKCNYLIVLYHGGKEHYQYPSPNLQAYCRKMVEYGADLVVCQHSHCIGCEENYHRSKIIYGQGNFIFDRPQNDLWNTGLLLKIILEEEQVTIDYITIEKTNNTIRLATNETSHQILSGFYERSNKINEPDFIHSNYSLFVRDNFTGYMIALNIIRPIRFFLRIIRKVLGNKVYVSLMSKKFLYGLLNIIECESHHEVFMTGLKEILKDWNKGITS